MAVPYYPQTVITPNLGLSLIGMDEVLAEDMVLIDAAFAAPPGSLLLQTNSVDNPDQLKLNLESNDGSVVLTTDLVGGVFLSSKAYADSHLNGALITGPITLGKIPIGQAGGTIVWADPVVQGVYPDGTNIAAPGTPGDLSTIQPVYIGGNKAGNLTGLVLDASGNLNINVASSSGPIAVTGTFFQATQPVSVASTVIVAGSLTNNNAAPIGDNIGVLSAKANASAPTYTEGDQVLLSTDLSGALRVNVGTVVANNDITEWASVTLGSPSNYGTSPGAVEVIGVNAFVTNTVAVTGTVGISGTVAVTQSGAWTVELGAGSAVIGHVITDSGSTTVVTGSVAVTGTFFQATQPVSGTVAISNFPVTQPVSGTVTALQGTSPWVVDFSAPQHVIVDSAALGTITITGTVAATQSGIWNVGVTGSVAVTGTFWQATQPVSIAGTVAVSLASTTITGTVAVTQSTSPWVVSGTVTTTPSGLQNVNLTQLNSVALGSPSNYGTSPGAVTVLGVNAFITNTPTVVGNKTNNNAAPGATNLGVLPAIANAAAPVWTEGDQVLLSEDLSGNLRVKDIAAEASLATIAGTELTGELSEPALAVIPIDRTNTYSAGSSGFVPAANPHSVAVLKGSATKKIRVKSLVVMVSATSGGSVAVFASKWSSNTSGGTSAAFNVAPLDSSYPAATTIPRAYTVDPSNGAFVGHVDVRWANFILASSGNEQMIVFDVDGTVLNSTSEELTVYFSGQGLPAGATINNVQFAWSEV